MLYFKSCLKYFFIHLLLLFFLAFSADASPKIELTTIELDYGKVPQYSQITKLVLVKNVGDQELVIGEIVSSCGGCIVGEISTKKIAPGATADLLVIIYSQGMKGKIKKRARILSNDPTAPQTIITAKAEAFELFKTKPQNLNFGNVPKGKVSTLKFKVISTDSKKFRISDMEFNKDLFDLSAKQTADDIVEFTLKLNPTAPEKPIFSKIILKVFSDKEYNIPLWVKGNVGNNLKNTPKPATRMRKGLNQ